MNNSILIQCIKKIINSSRYLNFFKKKTHISPDHDVDEDSNTYEQFYVDEDLCTNIRVLAVLAENSLSLHSRFEFLCVRLSSPWCLTCLLGLQRVFSRSGD